MYNLMQLYYTIYNLITKTTVLILDFELYETFYV